MKRRTFLKNAAYSASLAALPGLFAFNCKGDSKKGDRLVYIGTYTSSGSEGIYICRFDSASGRLSLLGVKKDVADPSFLATAANKDFLYAVNEINLFEGKAGGSVSSFRIDKESGDLHFLNSQYTGGAHPCHLTVSKNGKFVLAGNYSGGNFSVLPTDSDGSLRSPLQVIQHKGSSIDPRRQKSPHVHCLILDRSNTHLLLADLGMDRIFVYPFYENSGEIEESGAGYVSSQPGAGPRHLSFSPDERFLYCINELNSTITAYRYGKSTGRLTEIQSISTLPNDFRDSNTCADIHIHPCGRFLYGSNRGHDSISVFSRDIKTGILKRVQLVSTGGKNPRNFKLDPEGNFLLAANQNSNNIVSFRINQKTGLLQPAGEILEIPAPVCVKFL